MTLPLTIIGGYLGAGKTSLVNHLLRNADGLRLAVLVNEFGALPIDEDLIEARDDDIISLAGGCVCCSYGNELSLALMKMTEMDPPPDHVVLEASGVAIPRAIAASVSLIAGYSIDGIHVLADAETVELKSRDTYVGDTVRRQLDGADLVILNKTDLVREADLQDLHAWLRELAPGAEVIEAQHGAAPPAVILDSHLTNRRMGRSGSHHDADAFVTYTIDVDDLVDADALAQSLADPALGLIRAKGFVRTVSKDVQSVQVVGRRWATAHATDATAMGLIVIGIRSQIDIPAVQNAVRAANSGRKT